mgnify:CR=1 FL=1
MEFIYKGLKANYEKVKVTDEMVDKQLDMMRQQSPNITTIHGRPTELGDTVVLDYSGSVNGVKFAGGTAEKQTLTLGSGQFIPGFEEQLLGKNEGDEVVVKVTFPEQYHAAELAGKEAEFACKIHEIRVSKMYDLDDTFAKEVGGHDSLEAMRQNMKESLTMWYDSRSEQELRDKLIRMAAETLEFEATEEEIEKAVESQMDNMRNTLAQNGLTIEMYCQFTNSTEEEMRKDLVPEAINGLRMNAAIHKIAELENIETTHEEIAQALATICEQNNMTMEQFQEYYDNELHEAIKSSVLSGKVMAWIREYAEITVVEQ